MDYYSELKRIMPSYRHEPLLDQIGIRGAISIVDYENHFEKVEERKISSSYFKRNSNDRLNSVINSKTAARKTLSTSKRYTFIDGKFLFGFVY